MTDFRILGPLQVTIDGRPVPIGAPKQQALLVTLLVRVNEEVPLDELYPRLWGDRPPARPAAALHVHVARLRAVLGDRPGAPTTSPRPRVRSLGGGYALRTPPETVDLHRFRTSARRAEQARRGDDPAGELAHVRAALAQWHADAARPATVASLAVVPSLAEEVTPVLVEERLRLLERRYELELATRPPGELVTELRALVVAYPVCERLWCLLVTALQRAGDRTAALAAYERARATLRTRLGLTPGPELEAVYRRIAGDGWHTHTDLPPVDVDRQPRGPGWPAVAAALAGREAGTALPLVCLAGPPGPDRTADVVALARRLRAAFPDGQWYVRLADPTGRPRDPAEVLAELLRRSGMAADAVPLRRRELVTAYRARLADRRVLLVLDDVRDAEQVHDLLPGTSRCAVLTVGDAVVPELVALHGARPFAPQAWGGDPHASRHHGTGERPATTARVSSTQQGP
ncbi:AfsR/SARP family transcriptional regulator [Micromonospora sp. NPDC003241]